MHQEHQQTYISPPQYTIQHQEPASALPQQTTPAPHIVVNQDDEPTPPISKVAETDEQLSGAGYQIYKVWLVLLAFSSFIYLYECFQSDVWKTIVPILQVLNQLGHVFLMLRAMQKKKLDDAKFGWELSVTNFIFLLICIVIQASMFINQYGHGIFWGALIAISICYCLLVILPAGKVKDLLKKRELLLVADHLDRERLISHRGDPRYE